MKDLDLKRDERTRIEFCKIIGANEWRYSQTPTYFYRLWESYLKKGESGKYPWDLRKYPQQKDADMLMCKFIHKVYEMVSGLNVEQITIDWDR